MAKYSCKLAVLISTLSIPIGLLAEVFEAELSYDNRGAPPYNCSLIIYERRASSEIENIVKNKNKINQKYKFAIFSNKYEVFEDDLSKLGRCTIKLSNSDFSTKLLFCSLSSSRNNETQGRTPMLAASNQQYLLAQTYCSVTPTKDKGFSFHGSNTINAISSGNGICSFMCLTE